MFKLLFPKLFNERGEVVSATPASKGSAGTTTGSQSQQAEKLTGLLADIDLSDVPAEQRDSVKKYLEQKVKLYDSGYRSKTEDVAKERKELEKIKGELRDLEKLKNEIEGNETLKSKVTKVINDFRAGNITDDSSKGIKQLDKLIQNAPDAETRESLKQMREIINDEISDFRKVPDYVKKLEDKIAQLENATHMGQAERIDSKISKLKERFGDEIVGKYENDLRGLALKYPGQDLEKLFKFNASDDDLRAAYVKEDQTKKQREQEMKVKGSSAAIDSVQTPIELKKDKHGRTDIRDLVGKITSKIRR